MSKERTSATWPIRKWIGEHSGGFIVEDDQGYNFSFPTYVEAEVFRASCFAFTEEIKAREKRMVARFREELFS